MANDDKAEEALIERKTADKVKRISNGCTPSTARLAENGTTAAPIAIPDRAYDADGNPILTEMEMLQLDIKNATLVSLESTRRMIQYCNAAKEAGINTLVMLDEQGEQIERINECMDKINEDMKDAEKNLEGMEKCCGLCVLPWQKQKNFKKDSDYAATWKKEDDGNGNASGPRVIVCENTPATGGFITRITNDKYEKEMDENVVEVNVLIGNLRSMAVDMGNEIETQNQLLTRIGSKAQSNQSRVEAANSRANKLLK